MNSKAAGLLRFRKFISSFLGLTFIVWSFFVICYRVYVDTPAIGIGRVFIAEAKPYFFEKSTVAEKSLEFVSPAYKKLWIGLSNVSEMVTSYETEGAEIDFLESDYIRYIVINGEKIDPYSKMDSSHQKLFDDALVQVSAAEWDCLVALLIRDCFIWMCLASLSITWIVFLDKTTGVLF